MANLFQLDILTPERIFYTGRISSLVAPGAEGYFGVLAHHAPLIARSNGGRLKVTEESSQERFFQLGSGVIEVLKNRVVILAKQAGQIESGQAVRK